MHKDCLTSLATYNQSKGIPINCPTCRAEVKMDQVKNIELQTLDIDDDESIPRAPDPGQLNRDLTELVEIDINSKKNCELCTIDNPKSAVSCYMCGAVFPVN